MINLDELMLEH